MTLKELHAQFDKKHLECTKRKHSWVIYTEDPPNLKYGCSHCSAYGNIKLEVS